MALHFDISTFLDLFIYIELSIGVGRDRTLSSSVEFILDGQCLETSPHTYLST